MIVPLYNKISNSKTSKTTEIINVELRINCSYFCRIHILCPNLSNQNSRCICFLAHGNIHPLDNPHNCNHKNLRYKDQQKYCNPTPSPSSSLLTLQNQIKWLIRKINILPETNFLHLKIVSIISSKKLKKIKKEVSTSWCPKWDFRSWNEVYIKKNHIFNFIYRNECSYFRCFII